MRRIIHIEDNFSDIEKLRNLINNENYEFYPENKADCDNFIQKINLFLNNQSSENDLEELRTILVNADGFVIDYRLLGVKTDKKFTGLELYNKLIGSNQLLINKNVIFLTTYKNSSSEHKLIQDKITEITAKNSNCECHLLVKHNFKDVNNNKNIKGIFERLFRIINLPNF